MAVKLALDPQMFYSSSSVYELPDIVASLGYDWMELSPKADFVPFFRYPRIDDAGVTRLKKVASDAGVGIASVLPVLPAGRMTRSTLTASADNKPSHHGSGWPAATMRCKWAATLRRLSSARRSTT